MLHQIKNLGLKNPFKIGKLFILKKDKNYFIFFPAKTMPKKLICFLNNFNDNESAYLKTQYVIEEISSS